MKKILLILSALSTVAILLASCSSEQAPPTKIIIEQAPDSSSQ